MKPLDIYLDTSVYSALFDERDPVRQRQTDEFFRNIGLYRTYYSSLVLSEIERISDSKKRESMEELATKGKELDINSEGHELKLLYIDAGVIPTKFEDDALHIATTTVHNLDILLSWNFKHLVKRKTRIEINLINAREGYKIIEILAPPEL